MTMSLNKAAAELRLFEFNGKRASWAALRKLFHDVETALFFGMAVKMPWEKLNELLNGLLELQVLKALTDGEHSRELQTYLVSVAPPEVQVQMATVIYGAHVPHGEILPQMWEALDIGVAKSIGEVAEKLSGVLDSLPGTQGEMTFQSMMKLNRSRPTIGSYSAVIKHPHGSKNLVVLDVSGSMTKETITAIASDAVAMAYKANAAFAIVSNDTKYWDPGTYTVADILNNASYGGTHYETLAPLFNEDWGVVITIADYDSSMSAAHWVRDNSMGSIQKLLDLSLVGKPTFLAEVLGQLALEIEPILLSKGIISEYY